MERRGFLRMLGMGATAAAVAPALPAATPGATVMGIDWAVGPDVTVIQAHMIRPGTITADSLNLSGMTTTLFKREDGE